MDSKKSAPLVIGVMGTHIFPGKHANLGVSALCESVLKLSMQASPGVEVWLFDCHSSRESSVTLRPLGEDVSVRLVSWRLSLKSEWRQNLVLITLASIIYRLVPVAGLRNWLAGLFPWIRALEQVAFVGDIHGGDSFSDIYGFRRFFLAALSAWTVILVNGKLAQLPQTYGPFKGKAARWIAQFLLKRSTTVIARDKVSHKVAKSLLPEEGEVLLTPDVAFVLEPEPPSKVEVEPEKLLSREERFIGLNVNGLMLAGGYAGRDMFGLKMDYPAFLKQLVERLLEVQDRDLVLIPHTITPKGISESDNEGNEKLWASLSEENQKRVFMVQGVYNCHEIKSVIGMCDFFVGSRMHSCIAALSQGVPCVGVAYSMKFSGVFESVGMKDWVVDAREVDASAAVDRITQLYQERDTKRQSLSENVSQAKLLLGETFGKVFDGFSK